MIQLATNRFTQAIQGLGRVVLFFWDAFHSVIRWRVIWSDFLSQLYLIGVKSQTVVLTTGAFTGMVLCAQTYFQFHKVRIDTATLAVVSISMSSELGPVLTALMVIARVGASMAAELGTMRVTEQIDALRTLATHPIDYLVAPRLLATIIALPLLTIESVVIGIGAAYLLAVYLLRIDPTYSWENMLKYSHPDHVTIGLIKAIIFGGMIATIACYKGMNCGQGAEGVGKATTEAVVAASISILVANFFLTLLLTRLLGQ
jgi:phospholipid/cholesterol/gamma-HCH transport system permease protein